MKRSRLASAKSRQRIVEVAAAEFRRAGLDATSIAAVMSAAGMTHGGFYHHFSSKDQLIDEALTIAAMGYLDTLLAKAENGADADLSTVVDRYLNESHRTQQSQGCVFASLVSEIGQAKHVVRCSATEIFEHYLVVLTRRFSMSTEAAMGKLTSMIGALVVSRMLTDEGLAAAVLAEARARVAQPP